MGWHGPYEFEGNLCWRDLVSVTGFPYSQEGYWLLSWFLGDGDDVGDTYWEWKWCPRELVRTLQAARLWIDPATPAPVLFTPAPFCPAPSAPASTVAVVPARVGPY